MKSCGVIETNPKRYTESANDEMTQLYQVVWG